MKHFLTKNIKIKLAIASIICVCMFMLASKTVSAALILFDARVSQENAYAIDVIIDTEGESINTFEGTLQATNLTIQEIRDGNSVVNFWVERPHGTATGTIAFSGITPGGYNGKNGRLFTVVGVPLSSENPASIKVVQNRVLKNDGEGTEIIAKSSAVTLSETFVKNVAQARNDTDVPEIFVPEYGRSEGVYDNKWFIVFSAQDKNSGIDHYEIKEVSPLNIFTSGSWQRATSPHVLQHQSLNKFVYIKAIDKAGNERIVKLYPQKKGLLYMSYILWGILIVLLAWFVKKLLRRTWLKHKNSL